MKKGSDGFQTQKKPPHGWRDGGKFPKTGHGSFVDVISLEYLVLARIRSRAGGSIAAVTFAGKRVAIIRPSFDRDSNAEADIKQSGPYQGWAESRAFRQRCRAVGKGPVE